MICWLSLKIIGKDFLTYAPVNNVIGLGLTITLQDKLGNLDYIYPTKMDIYGYDSAAFMQGNFKDV